MNSKFLLMMLTFTIISANGPSFAGGAFSKAEEPKPTTTTRRAPLGQEGGGAAREEDPTATSRAMVLYNEFSYKGTQVFYARTAEFSMDDDSSAVIARNKDMCCFYVYKKSEPHPLESEFEKDSKTPSTESSLRACLDLIYGDLQSLGESLSKADQVGGVTGALDKLIEVHGINRDTQKVKIQRNGITGASLVRIELPDEKVAIFQVNEKPAT